MPNYDDSTERMITDLILGLRVDKAISLLPQHGGATDGGTYFNIVGGKILMTLLVGTITTVVQAQANNVVFSHAPTGGGATAALNAALSINAWAEGDILTINGLLTDAMLPAAKAGSSSAMRYGGVILMPGAITVDCSAASTGGWKWSLWYVPLEEGAYVTAA